MRSIVRRGGDRSRFVEALRTGRWQPTVLEEAEGALHRAHDPALTTVAFDLLNASRGVPPCALDAMLHRSDRLPFALAVRCEATARLLKRTDLVAMARRRRGPAPDPRVARWPTCLAHERLVPPWQRAAQADARRLLARQVDLDDWLARPRGDGTRRRSATRVALVGNSPSGLDQARGADIDACDVVIRFNNGIPRSRDASALGTRTDLHVVSPGALRELSRDGAIDPRRPLCLTGNPGWTRPGRYWRTSVVNVAAPLVVPPTATWQTLASTLGAPPTAGLLLRAALAACHRVDVLLHGFDPDGLAGGAANHHADATPASARHDLAAEARLVRTWSPR